MKPTLFTLHSTFYAYIFRHRLEQIQRIIRHTHTYGMSIELIDSSAVYADYDVCEYL